MIANGLPGWIAVLFLPSITGELDTMKSNRGQKKRIKKKKKLTTMLGEVLPEIGGELVSAVTGQESFKSAVEDIGDDLIAEFVTNKADRKQRRLFSLADIDTVADILRVKNSAMVSDKYSTRLTNWMIYDYDNDIWRMRAAIPRKGINEMTNVAIGKNLSVTHIHDATFRLTTEMGTVVYDDNASAIITYNLRPKANPNHRAPGIPAPVIQTKDSRTDD